MATQVHESHPAPGAATAPTQNPAAYTSGPKDLDPPPDHDSFEELAARGAEFMRRKLEKRRRK